MTAGLVLAANCLSVLLQFSAAVAELAPGLEKTFGSRDLIEQDVSIGVGDSAGARPGLTLSVLSRLMTSEEG